TNTANFCPWLNLVLQVAGQTISSGASGNIIVPPGIDVQYLAVGMVAAGGNSNGDPHGGGGGGAAFGYIPLTPGLTYPDAFNAGGQVTGDSGSFVAVTAGGNGQQGGAGGSGSLNGVATSPIPGFPVSGVFEGGDGGDGQFDEPGAGGGSAGTGGSGND